MKLISRLLTAFAVIVFIPVAHAENDRYAVMTAKIKVTSISPQVRGQINIAPPELRRKLDKAVHNGNLFVIEHFSGNAYDTGGGENRDWVSYTAPLLTMSRENWEQYVSSLGIKPKEVTQGGDQAYAIRITCPNISLATTQTNGEVTNLVYRTNVVGMLINREREDLYNFTPEGGGSTYEVGVELDKDGLVSRVEPSDSLEVWDYTALVYVMKEFFKYHVPLYPNTKEHEKEKIRVYKHVIRKIEESARHHCK